jgi:adenine-specific DNA-methyltransferase
MIKYIGSKQPLVATIVDIARRRPGYRHVLDLFSGASHVGHAFKKAGYRVTANDHNAYALTIARCHVEADREHVLDDARRLIRELNRLPGRPGYFTEIFCERSRFFQPKNGARIDAIREEVARKGLDPVLESVVLVSVMEAADRVDSTCGLQMAYLKKWAPRASNDLELRMPDVLPAVAAGPCRALGLDAVDAAKRVEADIAYLDPPYNQHSYLGNYHIWETLVRWDRPEVYGVACKRVDCRTRKSQFNSRRRCLDAFTRVVTAVRAPLVIVSFNNEGFLSREQIESVLAQRGEVLVLDFDFKRYVGAQIGQFNPSGKWVGAVTHLRNTEHIFVLKTELSTDRRPLSEAIGGACLVPSAGGVHRRRVADDSGPGDPPREIARGGHGLGPPLGPTDARGG